MNEYPRFRVIITKTVQYEEEITLFSGFEGELDEEIAEMCREKSLGYYDVVGPNDPIITCEPLNDKARAMKVWKNEQ